MNAKWLVVPLLAGLVAASGCTRPIAPAQTGEAASAAATVEGSAGELGSSTAGGPGENAATVAKPVRTMPVDPMFEIAASEFLRVAEWLANAPAETYDDAFRSRLVGASHALTQMPTLDAEPMRSVRKACGAIQLECAKLGSHVQTTSLAEIPDLKALKLDVCRERQAVLKRHVELVREALAKGEPLKLASDGRPLEDKQ